MTAVKKTVIAVIKKFYAQHSRSFAENGEGYLMHSPRMNAQSLKKTGLPWLGNLDTQGFVLV